jgi:hypothetical protein
MAELKAELKKYEEKLAHLRATDSADPAPIPVEGEDRVLGRGAVGDRKVKDLEQYSVVTSKKSFYFNSKAAAEKEAAELKRLGWKDVKVVPATDSADPAPIPVEGEDRVLGHGAVGDDEEFKPGDKVTTDVTPQVGIILSVAGSGDKTTALIRFGAPDKYGVADVRKLYTYLLRKSAKDSLRPVPISDETKYAERPRSARVITSVAAPTREDVERIYAKRDPEGFKKTFGKDAMNKEPWTNCPQCSGVGERTTGNKCTMCNGQGKVIIKKVTGAKDSSQNAREKDRRELVEWLERNKRILAKNRAAGFSESSNQVLLNEISEAESELKRLTRASAKDSINSWATKSGWAKGVVTYELSSQEGDPGKVNDYTALPKYWKNGKKFETEEPRSYGETIQWFSTLDAAKKAVEKAVEKSEVYWKAYKAKKGTKDSIKQMAHDSFYGRNIARGPGEMSRANDAAARAYGRDDRDSGMDRWNAASKELRLKWLKQFDIPVKFATRPLIDMDSYDREELLRALAKNVPRHATDDVSYKDVGQYRGFMIAQ